MQDKVAKPRTRMVRKQILITPEQAQLLKERSDATGMAESAIVRQALAREIGQELASDDGWKKRLLKLAGAWKDRDDLDEVMIKLRRSWDRTTEPEQRPSKRRR